MAGIFHNLQSGTLSADPGAAGVTLNSAAFANLPTVASPDTLRLTLDPDGALGLPEIVLVTTHVAASTACTVTRGQETANGGNAGLAHAIGTVWRSSITRLDMEELAYRKLTTTGDMLYASAANTTARLAKGTTGLPIVAGATVPAYAALDLSGISAALLEILCPAGSIRPTINATADTGWALFNQTLVGAQTAYPVLWGKAPAAWKSGADLVLPTMADKMLEGSGVTTLGGSGGANAKTITSGNLPTHTHLVDPPNTTVTIVDAGHNHAPLVGQFATTAAGTALGTFSSPGGTQNFFQQPNTTNVVTGITASVDIASFASANGAFANTALDVTPAHLAVVYQIKVH